MSVYNPLGQAVATLVDEVQPAGRHTVRFGWREVPSGVYFYRLRVGAYSEVKTMTLVR